MITLLKKIAKKWEKRLSTLWWIDILFPLFLSLVFFTEFIYLTYKGPQDQKIASQLEEKLIAFALKTVGPRSIKNNAHIVTVSQEGNFSSLEEERDHYLIILKKLLDENPKKIIVNFSLPGKFIKKDQKILEFFPSSEKIIWVKTPETWDTLSSKTPFLTGDSCSIFLQTICLYDKDKKNWVVQYLAEHFGAIFFETKESWYSKYLSHIPSHYLLFLNDPHEFKNYTFASILKQKKKLNLENKIIFMGKSFNKNKEISPEIRVQTPLNYKENTYTPLHYFWAQIAQMFIDHDGIHILHSFVSLFMALIFSSLLAFILFKKGPTLSFALLLSMIILSPLVNALLISLFRVYLPLVDCLCICLGSFIILCFIKLSMESFRDWQISCKEEVREESTRTKEHFISLMSHNINTSIAKMYGMLDLLIKFSPDVLLKNDASQSLELVVQMQHCIRSILVRASIEDQSFSAMPLTLEKIHTDFIQQFAPSLRRLKFSMQTVVLSHQNKDLPLKIDSRVFNSCVSALVTSFYTEQNRQLIDVDISFSQREWEEKLYLEVSVKSHHGLDPSLQESIDLLQIGKRIKDQARISLLHSVNLYLVQSLIEKYEGKIELNKSQGGASVISLSIHIF